MTQNPLARYFRQPAIHIRLPSQGRFYPPGALTETANGEYPVLPMTTMDEITYRTPDALFNGSAVVSVIESCVPNIRNAWHVPSVDIDTILVAIRIATYGHTMDITTRCPNCSTESDYGVDLRRVMERIQAPDYNKPLEVDDLRIFFKTMDYAQINENSMRQFEDQKTMQVLQDADLDDRQKLTQLGEVLKKITEFTSQAMAQNIARVETPEHVVDNTDHILELLVNSDRNLFSKIRARMVEIKQSSELQPLNMTCTNCGHQYQQVFTLDMTSFFADAS